MSADNLATTEIQETIDPENLEGEALDKAIAERTAKEAGETVEPSETKDDAETQDTEVQGAAEEVAQAQETTTEPEETELEKLKRTIEEKEKFNQRQATELGELRKQMLEIKRAQLPQLSPEELAQLDPEEAHRRGMEIQKAKQDFQSNEIQIYRAETEQAVKSQFQNFDELMPEIVALAKQDGVRDENLRKFQADPYIEPFPVLMQYAKRAQANKLLAEKEQKIKELESRTQNVSQQIDKAAKAKPKLTNTEGKTALAELPPLTEKEAMELSGEALDKELERRLQKEREQKEI